MKFLVVLDEKWFLATRPMVIVPNSSLIVPCDRTAFVSSRSITVTNKANSRTYTVASSFASTSPLAVITTVVFFDTLTVSNSASLRSFLLMLAPESTKMFLQVFLWMRLVLIIECCSVFLYWAERFFWKIPRHLRGRIALVLQTLLEICPQTS